MHRPIEQWQGLVLLAVALALFLVYALLPWRSWGDEIVEEWAASNGLRIIEAEDAGWFDRIETDSMTLVRNLWVVDGQGHQWKCRAEIGPMILGPFSRLKITWMSGR